MSVYKSLTTSDVIVTPFKVNKSFSFEGSSSFNLPNVSINRYLAKNIISPTFTPGSNPTGYTSPINQKLLYNSIKQLYYTNFLENEDGSPVLTSSLLPDGTRIGQGGTQPMYENYLSNTLDANRLFPTSSGDEIGVISIPSGLFGEYIKPGSFKFNYEGFNPITDDNEGNLFQDNKKIGDIIYQHGMVILTAVSSSIVGAIYNSSLYGVGTYGSDLGGLDPILTESNVTCSFQSTMTIYESQYKCTFSPNEFVYSQNPSIISSSCRNLEGKMWDFATSSYFEPYITTVGLYNSANELVAVGKLSQPLQSSNVTDTTILVNLDL